MEWKLSRSAGPRGYLVEKEEFETITITMPLEGIAKLTLNRPDKLNAFNSAMIGEIRAAMWRLSYDDSVRVIVLTGSGRGFSAGRDVKELQGERGMPLPHYRAYVLANHDMLDDLESIEKPVIAAINGVCAGGEVTIGNDLGARTIVVAAPFCDPAVRP